MIARRDVQARVRLGAHLLAFGAAISAALVELGLVVVPTLFTEPGRCRI